MEYLKMWLASWGLLGVDGTRGQSITPPRLNKQARSLRTSTRQSHSSIFAPCARWLRPITRARRRDLRAKKERKTCLGKVRLPSDRKRLGRDAVARASARYAVYSGDGQDPITTHTHQEANHKPITFFVIGPAWVYQMLSRRIVNALASDSRRV